MVKQIDILRLAHEAALMRWDKAHDRLAQAPASPYFKARYEEADKLYEEIRALLLAEEQEEGF